jgi:hypothetical protein
VCRVLEVVEKTESVAWKLEYDLPFFPEASPSTKRKLSPQVQQDSRFFHDVVGGGGLQ